MNNYIALFLKYYFYQNSTEWWSTVASLRWAKGPLWQQPMAEPDHEWSQVTNGQGVMMHAHSHVLRATHCHALLHYLCTLCQSCCILWSILQSTFTITTTSTHTHTRTTHAQNTRTQNNQDFNYFMTHTNCPTPSVHSGGHWRWSLISPAKMVPTIICQVGIDYTLTPLHSLILPFYYSGKDTLSSRSFLNVLYAF